LSDRESKKYLLKGRCSKSATPKDMVGVPVSELLRQLVANYNWRTGFAEYATHHRFVSAAKFYFHFLTAINKVN